MTQLASDNWVAQPNNSTLGANWTVAQDSGNAGFQIFGGAAVPVTSDNSHDQREVYTAVAAPADQYSEATIGGVSASGVGVGCGVCVRSDIATITYYRLIANASGWEVDKAVSGTDTVLNSGTSPTFATGDVVRLEFQGTTWRAKKNGTQFASGSDSSIVSGGWGLSYSSIDGVATLTSWAGGTPGGVPPSQFFLGAVLPLAPLSWIIRRRQQLQKEGRETQPRRSWRWNKRSRLFLPQFGEGSHDK